MPVIVGLDGSPAHQVIDHPVMDDQEVVGGLVAGPRSMAASNGSAAGSPGTFTPAATTLATRAPRKQRRVQAVSGGGRFLTGLAVKFPVKFARQATHGAAAPG